MALGLDAGGVGSGCWWRRILILSARAGAIRERYSVVGGLRCWVIAMLVAESEMMLIAKSSDAVTKSKYS